MESYHKSRWSPVLGYLLLMRLHRPIGWLLLLWPTWLALWGAAQGTPSLRLLGVFTIGVIVMRSAGCVINDGADRSFDAQVSRTKMRPWVTGQVSTRGAMGLLVGLLSLAFGLVYYGTNPLTVRLSWIAVALASLYPFMKRYTYYPQVVLGMAYAWGIPMAYAAQTGNIMMMSWILLFGATVLWTVAFDTVYAMMDRAEDINIGVKSTAIKFGHHDVTIIGLLQAGALILFGLWGIQTGLGQYYAIGWAVAGLLSLYQQYLIRTRDTSQCFRAFLNNQWVGASLFLGAWLDIAYR